MTQMMTQHNLISKDMICNDHGVTQIVFIHVDILFGGNVHSMALAMDTMRSAMRQGIVCEIEI